MPGSAGRRTQLQAAGGRVANQVTSVVGMPLCALGRRVADVVLF